GSQRPPLCRQDCVVARRQETAAHVINRANIRARFEGRIRRDLRMRLHAGRLISTSLVIALFLSAAVTGQRTAPSVFNFTASPGDNYDKAEFRLWHSGVPGPIRGVVVLTPGSNGDGRGDVDDPVWQSFAREHQLA